MLPTPNIPTPDDPLVVQVLKDYRARLDAREDLLMEQMAARWLQIERALDSDILALAYEMDRRREAGEIITTQMVYRSERYKILKAHMQDEILKYNRDYAIGAISQAQTDTGLLGITASNAAITASYFDAGTMGSVWNRLNINAIQSIIGFAGDGSPLNTLLKNDYPLAVNGLLQALINGVARGLGPQQTALNMTDGMGIGFDRALLIARTETARAYRTGSTLQYRQSGVCSGFMRLVKKSTACMACLMLDGQEFELEDELSDHPRGKCIVVPIINGIPKPSWQSPEDYFRSLTPAQQRARMGGEKYDLWRETGFPLSNFAKMAHSDTWGDSPRVANLSELTG